MKTGIATDEYDDSIEVWHCRPPRKGQRYQVVREEWTDLDADVAVRHIYEWRSAS